MILHLIPLRPFPAPFHILPCRKSAPLNPAKDMGSAVSFPVGARVERGRQKLIFVHFEAKITPDCNKLPNSAIQYVQKVPDLQLLLCFGFYRVIISRIFKLTRPPLYSPSGPATDYYGERSRVGLYKYLYQSY